MVQPISIRSATPNDATAICAILAANRDDPGLFQKSREAIVDSIGDFLVAVSEDGQIVGVAGLHQDRSDLGELYAVAVLPSCQGQGIGGRLVRAGLQRAAEASIANVWLATIKPAYFARYGFRPMKRWELPRAVLWRKLHQTIEQPATRWLKTLLGRHTFMRRGTGSLGK